MPKLVHIDSPDLEVGKQPPNPINAGVFVQFWIEDAAGEAELCSLMTVTKEKLPDYKQQLPDQRLPKRGLMVFQKFTWEAVEEYIWSRLKQCEQDRFPMLTEELLQWFTIYTC